MSSIRNTIRHAGVAIGISAVDVARRERTARARDFALARVFASSGRVGEARKILAPYDVGGVAIEIVPGESGEGEVK
jgi:hypothetical protein